MTLVLFVLGVVGFYAIGNAAWSFTCGYLVARGRGQMTAHIFPHLRLGSLLIGGCGALILSNNNSIIFAVAAVVAAAALAGVLQAHKTVQPGVGPRPQPDTGAAPIDWTTPAEPSIGRPTPLPSQPPPHPVQRCDRHPQSMQTDDGTCWGCLLERHRGDDPSCTDRSNET